MKTGFWRALIGGCSGTAIFSQLSEQRPWRAIWHLFLMTVLSTLVMTAGVYPAVRTVVLRSIAIVTEHCGGVQWSERGLTPLDDPDQVHSFMLPGPLAVNYLPSASPTPGEGGRTALPTDFNQDAKAGILWTPDRIGLWKQLDNGTFELSYLADAWGRLNDPRELAAATDLLPELAKAPALVWNGKELSGKFDGDRLRALANLALAPGVALVLFRQTLFEVVLYIAMFAIVFTLMSVGRPRRFRFVQLMVLAIYAGFPAMLAGSVAAALQLPVLSFNVVYVLGMTLYLMVIMNRLERNRQRREWEKSPGE